LYNGLRYKVDELIENCVVPIAMNWWAIFGLQLARGTTDDEEWEQVQDAVNVYCDLLPNPVTVVNGEYRLWHDKRH